MEQDKVVKLLANTPTSLCLATRVTSKQQKYYKSQYEMKQKRLVATRATAGE